MNELIYSLVIFSKHSCVELDSWHSVDTILSHKDLTMGKFMVKFTIVSRGIFLRTVSFWSTSAIIFVAPDCFLLSWFYLPWLPEVLVSFAVFPLVFILREAKRTSGGMWYKSHFHAELLFENLQNRFYILWRVLNFWVCHTTKIAHFRLFDSLV
jgi:hypothetical protein